MKNRAISLLVVLTMLVALLTGCGTGGAKSSAPGAATEAPTAGTEAPQTESSAPEASGNLSGTATWYSDLGTPQYGGEIVFASNRVEENLDVYSSGYSLTYYYLEPLFIPDWGVDRSEYAFLTNFIPQEYYEGCLAESYEWVDDTTLHVYLRDDVYWQDKEPVNGRQFVAGDVAYHYSRMMGINEFAGQDPAAKYVNRLAALADVKAVDDLTVAFYFKEASFKNIYVLLDQDAYNYIMAPEVVDSGHAGDWEYAVGTGPWVLTDFISGNSYTFEKNPDYRGHDERYPENQLPYADTLTVLKVADKSTLVSYLRTGEVDFADELSYQQMSVLGEDNTEMSVYSIPPVATEGIQLNMKKVAAFADIRVRQALQMALDRDTIAKQYYGLESGTPAGWVSPTNKAFAYTYDQWSDELKSQYSYDPDGAKALLAEAGYPDLTFTIIAETTADITLLEVIKSYYAAVGVTMNIETYDNATLSGFRDSKDYEAFWTKNTASGAQPWTMAAMDYSTLTTNYCQADDPDYDVLVDQLGQAQTEEEVQQLCQALDEHVITNHWGIRLFPITVYNIELPTVSGYSGENLFRMGSPGGWFWARCWNVG